MVIKPNLHTINLTFLKKKYFKINYYVKTQKENYFETNISKQIYYNLTENANIHLFYSKILKLSTN